MKLFIKILLISLSGLLVGCSASQIHPLTDKKFPAKPATEEIDLYMGKVERPHIEIAIVDSRSLPGREDKDKQLQLNDLKHLARKLGADAVHDIRLLHKKARGMVIDERVPFPAWKQGEYKLYFLRGTAIKFLADEDQETTATRTTTLP